MFEMSVVWDDELWPMLITEPPKWPRWTAWEIHTHKCNAMNYTANQKFFSGTSIKFQEISSISSSCRGCNSSSSSSMVRLKQDIIWGRRCNALHCVSKKTRQLWNSIAQNYTDRFRWDLAEIFKILQNKVCMFQFLHRFALLWTFRL